MNVAVSLGIKFVDAGEHDGDDLDDIWIYILAFVIGGALAAVLHWGFELGIQKTGAEKSGESKPLKAENKPAEQGV